jgi:hypothetical protein
MCELALEQVSDADLVYRPTEESNTLAIIVRHLSGNLRSRFTDFLTSDGEKPWRARDEEFEPPEGGRDELMARWATAWEVVEQSLRDVAEAGPDVMARTLTIRGQEVSVQDAYLRSIAHVAYHTGQVVWLARERAGAAWRTLSIPRGGSAAYAAAPTREKSPDGPNER